MSAVKKAEVAVVEQAPAPASIATDTSAMISMIERIITDPSLPIERVNQAFDFYLRVEASQAKKAFDAALAAAQAEFPPIEKNRRVAFESKDRTKPATDYRHEDLAEIVEKCGPILAKHGISHKWRTRNELNEPIIVTCVLTHKAGHSEENSLRGPRDESGNKNSLQGVASTVTYLERYTFKSAIGVASRHDDDGKAGGAEDTITQEQEDQIREQIESTESNLAAFCGWLKVEKLSDIKATDFERAIKALGAKAKKK